MNIEHIDKEGT